MARKPPTIEKPTLERKSKSSIISRSYRMLTPIFGGGVEGGRNDPITPIRGTSIRGQLRFWWRATCGGVIDGAGKSDKELLANMRCREGEIWGWAVDHDQTQSATKATLWVEHDSSNDRDVSVRETPQYARFPLDNMDDPPHKLVQPTQWTLHIDVSSLSEKQRFEVEAALWAWETFGGIGARTRRGFGAFERTDVQATLTEQSLAQACQRYILDATWPQHVPNLSIAADQAFIGTRIKLLNLRYDSPGRSWNQAIKSLQQFRQKKDAGITSGQRTDWPEADQIRRLWQAYTREDTYLQPQHPGQGFPRAAFGLPIVFHFKDERRGDPGDTQLQGVGGLRWASRLILRPVRRDANTYDVVAVLLNGSIMPELELVHGKKSLTPSSPPTDLHRAGVTSFTGVADNALEAFWNML